MSTGMESMDRGNGDIRVRMKNSHPRQRQPKEGAHEGAELIARCAKDRSFLWWFMFYKFL